MSLTEITRQDAVTTLTLTRGKVHPLNEASVDHLIERFGELRDDTETKAVVLTGAGSFFSFGLDVPELYGYSPEDFARFLTKFTSLYLSLFEFPKPLVAAINGHAVAGGFMLSTPCDYRVMASGKAKISLNEITFGSTLFSGALDILKCVVGHRNAETIAFSGAMHSAEEARDFGLVDIVTEPDLVLVGAQKHAYEMSQRDAVAFADIKRLLRAPIIARIKRDEAGSIKRFVEIWYSDSTREQIKGIVIR